MDSKVPIDIFISYAHEDKKLREKLDTHLSNLKNLQLIRSWYDGEIIPGNEWEVQIKDHLNSAQIILLLISPDFLASSFCNGVELKRAMERHECGEICVIPIILRNVDWQGAVFSKLQVLPPEGRPITSWKNRDDAFFTIVKELRKVITSFTPESRDVSFKLFSSEGIAPPTDPKSVVQRKEVVKDVYARLLQPETSALALTGLGGIGKSTLASLICNHAEEQRRLGNSPFTAQTIWLRIDPGHTTTELATDLFESLDIGQFKFSHLTPIRQAKALFHALNTVNQARLIILDQFENLLDPQTGSVLPICAGIGEWLDALNNQQCCCRVLLTSRLFPHGVQEYTEAHLHEYRIPELTLDEGAELLRKQDVDTSNDKLRDAVKHCQGHGLSLILLASVLRNHSLNLSTFFEDTDGVAVWTEKIARKLLDNIFTQQLSEEQRKLLSAFSIYREPVPLDAAQAILITDARSSKTKEKLHIACEVLLAQGLLQARGNGYYQPHAIVADYTRGHFTKQNKRANQKALYKAHARAAHYYQQLINANDPLLKMQRISEMRPVVEAVWHLCQSEQWQQAYAFMEQKQLFILLKRLGGNLILLELYKLLLPLEKWDTASRDMISIYSRLGDIYRTLGQGSQAEYYLKQAAHLCEQEMISRGESWNTNGLGRDYNWTLNNLGRLSKMRNQLEQARIYFKEALTLCRKTGDRGDQITTLNDLASVYILQGQNEEAQKLHEQALTLAREIKDRGKEATSLKYLGNVCVNLMQKELAQKYFEKALHIQKEEGLWGEVGKTLSALGMMYSIGKQREKAIISFEEAVEILRETGDRFGEGEVHEKLGQVYRTLERTEEALTHFGEAWNVYHELDNQEKEGMILLDIGMIYFKQDNFRVALACFLQALKVFENISDVYSNEAQKKIEILRKKVGKKSLISLSTQVDYQTPLIIEQSLTTARENIALPKKGQ